MKIVESEDFKSSLKKITNYIKKDKIRASIEFAKDLILQIKDLKSSPFKYRKSIYFDDMSIRDMIFKEYTITYKIYEEKNTIIALDIFNKNKP